MEDNQLEPYALLHRLRSLNLYRFKSLLVIEDSAIIIKLMNNVKIASNGKLNHLIERIKHESLHIEDIKFFHVV